MTEEIIDQMAEIEEMKKKEKSETSEDIVEEGEEEVKEDKKPKKERVGVLNIYTSKNNTILNLTDMAGSTICKATGGQSTKQDRLKSSPTVAMFSSKKIAEEANEAGITSLYVRVRAETGESSPSSSAHAVVKSLGRDGFKIISISDITRTPRGGPKKAGGRRGRRV